MLSPLWHTEKKRGQIYFLLMKVNLSPFLFFLAIIFSLFYPCNSAQAANLSIELGRDSTSVAAGRDFGFGYGMVGISATFTTDAPWSYVETTETLNSPCLTFQSDPTKDCVPKGYFHDGDEWEVFGKLGYRLPIIPMVYINTGMGVSKQRTAELYIFCTGIEDPTGGCPSARLFETWGRVDDDYFLTFLGGLTVEMTHQLLLNIDYHTRNGFISGLMWRF